MPSVVARVTQGQRGPAAAGQQAEPVAEPARDLGHGQHPGAQVQRGQQGAADQRRVAHLGQLGQPRPVPEPAAQVRGEPHRQPGLADPAGPGQGDQPGLGERAPDLGGLAAAADEAGRLGGQVARPPGGPRHALILPDR
jgi:hypothetical protein